jgi:hypothetical protein
MHAPIVLFVFNRHEHTRRTVEALARNALAKESALWVFSDGPRSTSDDAKIQEVRDYVRNLPQRRWFASVQVIAADRNHGLAQSIIRGVTRVFTEHDRAIVLEDDLVTAPDFLVFMNACLDYYEPLADVGSVTGYSPLNRLPDDYASSVYLLPRSCSLGWGTWRNRWRRVDWEVREFAKIRDSFLDRLRFDACGSDRYYRLRRQIERGIDSWSIRFGYWQHRQGMNTVYSFPSRILNIGDDGSGVHESGTYNTDLASSPVPFTLSTPPPDRRIMAQVSKMYSGAPHSRFARFLLNNGLARFEPALRSLLRR